MIRRSGVTHADHSSDTQGSGERVKKLPDLINDGECRAALTRAIALWRRKPVRELAAIASELDSRLEVKNLAAVDPSDPAELPRSFKRVRNAGNTVEIRKGLESLMKTWPPDPRMFGLFVGMFEHPDYDIARGNPRLLYEAVVGYLHDLHELSFLADAQQHDVLSFEKGGVVLELAAWEPSEIARRIATLEAQDGEGEGSAPVRLIRLKPRADTVPDALLDACKRVAKHVEVVAPK